SARASRKVAAQGKHAGDERGRDERGRDERGRDERGRDERGRDERGRDERGRLPAWWPIAACCIGLGIVAGFLWLRSGPAVEPTSTDPKKEPEQIVKPKELEKPREPDQKPQPEVIGSIGPPEQELKRIIKLDDVERSTWTREVYGPFQAFPT